MLRKLQIREKEKEWKRGGAGGGGGGGGAERVGGASANQPTNQLTNN